MATTFSPCSYLSTSQGFHAHFKQQKLKFWCSSMMKQRKNELVLNRRKCIATYSEKMMIIVSKAAATITSINDVVVDERIFTFDYY